MSKLSLNDHLDEQLERLRNEDMTAEELDLELKRTKGIAAMAAMKIENNKSIIKAVAMLADKDERESYLNGFGVHKNKLIE